MIRGRIAIPDRKKRKQPVMASAIVTPAPMKKRLKGPVIRLSEEVSPQTTLPHTGSTIVTPAAPKRRLAPRDIPAIIEVKPRRRHAHLLAHCSTMKGATRSIGAAVTSLPSCSARSCGGLLRHRRNRDVWVRSGKFFGDDDPPETPPVSSIVAILLVVVPVTFAVLVLLVRIFFRR